MNGNANHAIKKVSKGCTNNEQNLCVAAAVGACCLTKKISDPAFKSCLKSVFKDKKLDVSFKILIFREITLASGMLLAKMNH